MFQSLATIRLELQVSRPSPELLEHARPYPDFLPPFYRDHASFCRDILFTVQRTLRLIFALASTHKMDTDIPLSELGPILSTAGAEIHP